MKKIIALVILSAATAQGQQTDSKEFIYLNEQEYTVYSTDYKAAKARLEAFISRYQYTVVKQEETKNSHYYEFNVPVTLRARIDSMAATLGYISYKQLTAYNNEDKLEAARIDLATQQNKKKEYESLLVKMDSVKSPKYYQHWEKIREIETEIAWTQKKINQLEKISPLYRVKIRINDEQVNPTNTKVSFVNMPGVQYSALFTENPLAGSSYAAYHGVFLKYLFTKGKSYFSLGVLKALEETGSDTLRAVTNNEVFNLAFGQDFYSKRFGRGSRRWLNLYVTYQAGASMYFNKTRAITIPFANPGVGLEIFKNKYVLVDSNVYYFLPLSDSYNRNMRGWLPSLSFNFVF
jgi:hypothetical protein